MQIPQLRIEVLDRDIIWGQGGGEGSVFISINSVKILNKINHHIMFICYLRCIFGDSLWITENSLSGFISEQLVISLMANVFFSIIMELFKYLSYENNARRKHIGCHKDVCNYLKSNSRLERKQYESSEAWNDRQTVTQTKHGKQLALIKQQRCHMCGARTVR